ncbi:MAG TPA: magnesium/cobalt transporter CorA [Tepidisphaeraceae bacterium]|nr:magnesium/cobalt transporter CorA [Tepidisphaeraceae bacterium]
MAVSAFIKFGDGRISDDPSHRNLAAALRDPGAVMWIDIEKPEDEDYSILDEVFGFHPLAIEDSINRAQRPKIESYNHVGDACQQGYFYMVIHGAEAPKNAGAKLQTEELDMFVSERYLITIHDDSMSSLNVLLARARSDPRIVLEPGIDMLLHHVLDRLVDKYQPILEELQDTLDELEEDAITDPTPTLLTRITMKKRELLNLRRIIGPQREVLAQLTRGEVPFIRESTRIYLRDVLDHLIRAVETIELYRDLVVGVRDIYMSSISNNLNQIMKTLTIITVIALPMTVVTSFFGMNFNDERVGGWGWLLNNAAGFWLSMLFILTVVAALLLLFRKRRWL